MKTGFHYVVKSKVIRYKNANEINFPEYLEIFENEDPILARESAFNYYRNLIDVLLESQNKNHLSDKQARKDLISFIDTGTKTKIKIGENEIELSDCISNGIGIFLVIDKPITENVWSNKIGDEILIHGIGYVSNFEDYTDVIIIGLEQEFDYYKHYKYRTLNKEIQVIYCDRGEWEEGYTEDEPCTYTILETPFDWTGYDKPYWWGEPEESKEEVQQITKTVEQIIEGGEGNQVEFKPTLLYNSETKKAGVGKKIIIAKTICAFLNANGGCLLIGVNDDKTIRGLSNDFGLSNGKDPKDFFLLEFDEMIEQFISTSIINNVRGDFFQVEGKEIFVVTVQPSKRRPIFFKGQEGKEFFVRKLASSKRIHDIEEITNYCIDKWTT